MAFQLDATPSGSTANSYVDQSSADDYFSGRFGADAWFAFTDAQKQQLLVSATRIIDTCIFGGFKAIPLQPLQWPRRNVFNREGRPIFGMPAKLLEATYELAKWIWEEPDRMLSDNELMQIDTYKVGPLDVKFTGEKYIFPIKVDQLLKAIGPNIVLTTVGNGNASTNVRLSR
jgi:hypothetical protein